MNLHLITPPILQPVSLAEVKTGAGFDLTDTSEDARIAGLTRAAVQLVDGPDGEIQRALITQTWELRLDAFPGYWPCRPHIRWPSNFCPPKTEIEIPLPPLQAVTSITYLSGGDEVTLDSSEYTVAGVGDRHRARIRPVSAWPSTDDVLEAVTIEFRCGYGDSWNDVPESIRLAIVAKVQALYDGCENGLAETLLRPYRVDFGFA